MIQRVQSIWLFLAALTLFLLLISPILSTGNPPAGLTYQIGGVYSKTDGAKVESFTALFGGTIVVGLICLVNIFSFRNRSLQKRIILLTIILILILIGWTAANLLNIPNILQEFKLSIGAFLPILSIIFCLLAIRGINNDDKLIRSADRLR
ncbi:hypothetical protein TH53_23445 [Pedobacter lusitanus]|uniref:DUF4293 family protein n=1 Tax=Pedobacter lusitanus TaxID=1503925 RepID=A0A0D0F002_9SPHI|nr:DUF4293 domain-containing protein [Pedobacter lusitanus]KIO74948.1 hypothetical protein TH53_23445 [Pedobacter lusitanus]